MQAFSIVQAFLTENEILHILQLGNVHETRDKTINKTYNNERTTSF